VQQGEEKMQRKFAAGILAIMGLSLGHSAFAITNGPIMTPLKVSQMYTRHASGAIYVAFQSGAMPGCYGNSGGYLRTDNSLFKELYSQMLTLIASGGFRANVVYTQHTPTNNWSDCTIEGIQLLPE
jgi:hypothetical protein